jgi:hypothetical protein
MYRVEGRSNLVARHTRLKREHLPLARDRFGLPWGSSHVSWVTCLAKGGPRR